MSDASLDAALRAALARELDDAVRLRHHRHAHPELSGSEHHTVTIVEGEPALVNDEAPAAASWPRLPEAGFTVDTSFRFCGPATSSATPAARRR